LNSETSSREQHSHGLSNGSEKDKGGGSCAGEEAEEERRRKGDGTAVCGGGRRTHQRSTISIATVLLRYRQKAEEQNGEERERELSG
jgi:hypothetical protein